MSLNNKNKNEKQHCVKLTTVLLFVIQRDEPPEE
jgi:hypothetical protein